MVVQSFELFHGIVLTKLARHEKPMTLRLIETKTRDSWSEYLINTSVHLFVKHSVSPSQRIKGPITVWNFTFSKHEIDKIAQTKERSHVVLVCGVESLCPDAMSVCLLNPIQVSELLDFTKTAALSQSIRVAAEPRKSLRVSNVNVKDMVIPRNALDRWVVPGT